MKAPTNASSALAATYTRCVKLTKIDIDIFCVNLLSLIRDTVIKFVKLDSQNICMKIMHSIRYFTYLSKKVFLLVPSLLSAFILFSSLPGFNFLQAFCFIISVFYHSHPYHYLFVIERQTGLAAIEPMPHI